MFFSAKATIFVKNNGETSLIGDVYFFRMTARISMKPPVHAKGRHLFLLQSNHARNCYVCYWHVFVAIKNQV